MQWLEEQESKCIQSFTREISVSNSEMNFQYIKVGNLMSKQQ
jgi:hypothetical protein